MLDAVVNEENTTTSSTPIITQHNATSIANLSHIRRTTVVQEVAEARLSSLLPVMLATFSSQQDEEEGTEADATMLAEVVERLRLAVHAYRTLFSESIERYRVALLEVEREEHALQAVRTLTLGFRRSLESYHYSLPEHAELVDRLEAFVTTMANTDRLVHNSRIVRRELRAMRALCDSSQCLRSVFEIPLCPICLERKSDRKLQCGHLFCALCVQELRAQSNDDPLSRGMLGADEVSIAGNRLFGLTNPTTTPTTTALPAFLVGHRVTCPMCRSVASIDAVSTLYFNNDDRGA